MTSDEEIGVEVRQRAKEFCAALNKAGEAGLLIDISFGSTSRSTLTDGMVKVTGWYSGTSLKRVHFV